MKASGSGGHVLSAFYADDETAVLLAALGGELGVLLLGHLRCVAEQGSGGRQGGCPVAVFFFGTPVVGTTE